MTRTKARSKGIRVGLGLRILLAQLKQVGRQEFLGKCAVDDVVDVGLGKIFSFDADRNLLGPRITQLLVEGNHLLVINEFAADAHEVVLGAEIFDRPLRRVQIGAQGIKAGIECLRRPLHQAGLGGVFRSEIGVDQSVGDESRLVRIASGDAHIDDEGFRVTRHGQRFGEGIDRFGFHFLVGFAAGEQLFDERNAACQSARIRRTIEFRITRQIELVDDFGQDSVRGQDLDLAVGHRDHGLGRQDLVAEIVIGDPDFTGVNEHFRLGIIMMRRAQRDKHARNCAYNGRGNDKPAMAPDGSDENANIDERALIVFVVIAVRARIAFMGHGLSSVSPDRLGFRNCFLLRRTMHL